MAKQIYQVQVTLQTDLGSPPSEALVLDAGKIDYVVCDTVDDELIKGQTDVPLDTIVDTDTISAWWTKVLNQIKTAEGI
jgi:hypothetical protein